MSADPNNPDTLLASLTYQQQLSALKSHLQGQADDETMLADLGAAMRALLSDNAESEGDIRRTLQEQFAAGHLRQETFELVQNLLGKIATEEMVRTSPPQTGEITEDVFASTAVIDDQAKMQFEARVASKPPETKTTESVSAATVQVGSVLRDRFLLKERVSEGSMGVVYKALDRRLAEAGDDECSVAIKVLRPELARHGSALRALQQEASKGRCLTHPNIVRFIDLDREGELYFIVMEWLEGRSLASMLDANGGGSLGIGTSMGIVRQISQALDYAHKRGVIHADVKPGNVMMTPEGEAKLVDFGVAKVKQKENEGKGRVDPLTMFTGTPAYSSMQVLTGEDPVAADDVFSLACLFYRLVAGYRVYGPRNAAQAAEDGMEPQQPQQLTNALWQPVRKALSYSRVTRYASPGAFIAALDDVGAFGSPVEKVATKEPPVSSVPNIRTAAPTAASVADEATASITGKMMQPELPNELPQPKRGAGAPIRAGNDSIMYEPEEDEPRRSSWGLVFFVLIAAGLGYVATQTDLVDQIGQAVETVDVSPVVDVFSEPPEIIDAPVIDESAQDIAEYIPEVSEDSVGELTAIPDTADASVSDTPTADELVDETAVEEPAPVETDSELELPAAVENSIDWSLLPPAAATVNLSTDQNDSVSASLAIREDGDPANIDFVRTDAAEELTIILSESEYSGNRSPQESGQYSIENNGEVTFARGQDRARLTISMRSNPVREADRDVTLQVNARSNVEGVLATIELRLEDDDQRRFENGLPPNTIAFAVNQISVRESDPAAQIDVIRYRPDNSSIEAEYELVDVTANEGQDYFAPDLAVIYFAPGQRTARILIPLGQDARPEDDEAFMLELDSTSAPAGADLFSQIAVMIRDDDT